MFKKILSNTISQAISKVLTAIISVFLIGTLTKYLTPELYGEYNKIYNYLAIFTFLADLGLYAITVREISKDKSKAKFIIGNAMSLRLLLGIVVVVFAFGLAFLLPSYNSKLTLISIGIISIYSVVSLLNSSVLSLMQSFMKVEFGALSFVLGKLANLFLILGVVFIVFPKGGLLSYDMAFILIILSGLVGVLINYFLNLYYANKIVKISFLFDWTYMRHLFFISLPNGIALFLATIYFNIDIVLLSLLEAPDISNISIALYSLPMKIIEVFMTIGVFYLNSILPSFTSYIEKKDFIKLKEVFRYSMRILMSFGLFIVIIGMIFGSNFIEIMATPDYLDKTIHRFTSYDVLSITLFILLFNSTAGLFNYIFIASKNEKTLVKINLIVTIINIVGNIALIPYLSFMGAAITTLISQIVLFILGYFYSKKIVKLSLDIFYIIKISIASFGLYLLGDYMVSNYSVGLVLDIFIYGFMIGILYLVVLFVLNYRFFIKNN